MPQVALITDSASYIPPALRVKHGIRVVPLNVQLGDESYEESDLDVEDFYDRIAAGVSVSTSQPSPGQFLEAYELAHKDGAEAVLSVHIGSNISGTVQSARLGAESASIPVTVVDTGQASFAEGLCVLEAAGALARGESVEAACAIAMAASKTIGNTFVVRAMGLAERSGRMAPGQATYVEGVPVLAMTPEGMKVLTSATTLEEAVETMAEQIEAAAEAIDGRRLRVGIGHGAASEIAEALRARVAGIAGVDEVISYVVGPAVGAHVGPGNAGAVFIARPVTLE